MHIPILFFGCLASLLVQLQRAGWSYRRLDRRPTYWSAVGILLAGAAWSREALPGSALCLLLGAVAGLGLLWGLWMESAERKR